jgi:putative transposase
MIDRTHDGRAFRIMTIIDEYTWECLNIVVGRRLGSNDVIDVLADLFIRRGPPEHIRSGNGSQFCARAVREWLSRLGCRTVVHRAWENGYSESFNGELRDELLDREIFYTLEEAKVLIENWRREYNTIRLHSSLDYRPPAPGALPWPPAVACAPGGSLD